jgi:hypothetical protein
MIRAAGYDDAADEVDADAVASAIPQVQAAIREVSG